MSSAPAMLLVRGLIEGHSPAKLNHCLLYVCICSSDFFMLLVSPTRVLDNCFCFVLNNIMATLALLQTDLPGEPLCWRQTNRFN